MIHLNDPKANVICQMYVPVTDLSLHGYGIYPEIFGDVDAQMDAVYPHLYPGFYAMTDDISILTSNLLNSSPEGNIYVTEDATFDIYHTRNSYFDGRRNGLGILGGAHVYPGWSVTDTTGFGVGATQG